MTIAAIQKWAEDNPDKIKASRKRYRERHPRKKENRQRDELIVEHSTAIYRKLALQLGRSYLA